ncbi:MAG: DUF5661 family protein [Archangium sp.]|nr:DUF5661 family protein [Archangium sp.]
MQKFAKFAKFADAVAARADADTLAHYVVDAVSAFTDGKDVTFDFLARGSVGTFCKSIGLKRNWAELSLEEIAPLDERDINVVPLGEAAHVLALMKALIRDHYLTPSEYDRAKRAILNDFLPRGARFANQKTCGYLWEFAYALAVELEHGRERGQNITMNHPLLTGMVVLAHLAEDRLYYARLLVMETEGELFNAQLKDTPPSKLRAGLEKLSWAQQRLGARKDEKLAAARITP